MLNSGLVSISFRAHSATEIASAASAAGLKTIEWGSDVHLPPTDVDARERVIALCRELGISTPTYGSYFRIGTTPCEDFTAMLDTAEAIGAKVVRVWGGTRYTTESDEEWPLLVSEARRISALAEARGITVALECHRNTVTEYPENALAFIRAVGSDSLRMYWQPNQYRSCEENTESAKMLAPYIDCIHVFNWSGSARLPLRDAKDEWIEYLTAFKSEYERRDIPALLEFMPDGSIDTLSRETEALGEILSALG